MPTFIIGSKPQAEWPTESAGVIYCANGALARARAICHRAKIVHVMTDLMLSDAAGAEEARCAVSGLSADRLVLIRAAPENWPRMGLSELNVQYTEVAEMDLMERQRFTLAALGPRFVVRCGMQAANLRGKIAFAKNMILDREVKAAKISTGILALLLALSDERASPPYYLIGIGIEEGGHYYRSAVPYGGRHLVPDRIALETLAARWKQRGCLYSTDSALARITGMDVLPSRRATAE